MYNVPLRRRSVHYRGHARVHGATGEELLPALLCSFVATLTAWAYLPTHATYVDIPAYHFSGTIMVCALVMGPVVGVLASGYIRLIGWVSYHRVSGFKMIPAMLGAFGALGLIGFAYPQLFGNGKDMTHDALVGQGTLLAFLALFILKPLVTALCLESGAAGGVFTPTLSTGAAFGCVRVAWHGREHLWPGSPVGAYAMVGAAAMIGAAMPERRPWPAWSLWSELTRSGFQLMVPMIAATAIATAVQSLHRRLFDIFLLPPPGGWLRRRIPRRHSRGAIIDAPSLSS